MPAFSIETQPPITIKSSNETFFFLPSNCFLIFSNTLITLSVFDALFTSQFFWGSSLNLAPFAPPLLSDPLKVDADAHAADTNSEILSPHFKI